MFGLSQVSWSSFLLSTFALLVAFNGLVWGYYRWIASSKHDRSEQQRQDKFHHSLPF
ncbi:MAG: hypothetical protein IKC81_05855 [Paludibacteraceae bacterium]|nr:hypothetical protein [Paludibacteraceae bacterium]